MLWPIFGKMAVVNNSFTASGEYFSPDDSIAKLLDPDQA